MRKFLSVTLAATLLLSMVAGCTPSAGKKDQQTIQIGVLAPLTGNFAEHGKGFQTAFEMAVEEVNAAGGINGKTLELTINDTEGDQKKAADLASVYAEDENYLAILGGFSSGCAMAAAPVCDEAGIPFVSPTASNVAFTQMSDYCFSMPGISQEESLLMSINCCSGYAKAKSVFVFALNSDWGLSALEGFRKGAEQTGLLVLGEETYVSGETDFSAMITKASATDPDMFVILDQAPGILINQIRTAGLTTPIGDYGASTSNEVITLCGENAEGLMTIGLTLDMEKEKTQKFVKDFTAKAGFDPTMWAAYAYDAAYVLFDAMKRCGDDLTRENIQQQLTQTSGDYLLGSTSFNSDGNRLLDPENAPYKVSIVEDGVWVAVQ